MSLFFVLLAAQFGFALSNFVHHQMNVVIQPQDHKIQVIDQIQIQSCLHPQDLEFSLHSGMSPQSANAKVSYLRREVRSVPVDIYRLSLVAGQCSLRLSYAGQIYHPPQEELAPGSIQNEGVTLMGSTYWYPQFESVSLSTIDLTTSSPKGWFVVSQGESVFEDLSKDIWQFQWRETRPQDALYLIAGKFDRSISVSDGLKSYVYLRTKDDGLAQMYHQLTHENIQLYSQQIGPYPYAKFATIENFWQTGFGLPSMTLLGPSVIRLPFLAYSSFPHEILHNWWGNGVYINYDQGNWSEGLTSYMADHYYQKLQGQDSSYRRAALQNFSSYVKSGNDFPLKDFKGRHNDSSKAVGYDKSLFLFHMLKVLIGEKNFYAGLAKFYRDNLFREASFDDLKQSFSEVSGRDLTKFFKQWTHRKGAPRLFLEKSTLEQQPEGGFRVKVELKQEVGGEPYNLRVPWEIKKVDGGIVSGVKDMVAFKDSFEVELSSPAVSLSVDPNFDVFRTLHSEEVPKVLANVMGETQEIQKVILPDSNISSFRTFFNKWQEQKDNQFQFFDGRDYSQLPTSQVVWLVGWDNPFLNEVIHLASVQNIQLTSKGITFPGQPFLSASDQSVLFVFRRPQTDQLLVWLGVDNKTDLSTLARKVTHYGKYSYLSFTPNGKNIEKGQWQVTDSPLIIRFK